MIGVNPDWDFLLDEQQRHPVGFCPVCGAEVYAPDSACIKCLRKVVPDDGE